LRVFQAGADDARAGPPALPVGDASAVFKPSFSPDGRWVAYTELTDTPNVYVSPFPFNSGGRRRITNDGGAWSEWSQNGRELFVGTAEGLLAFTMTTEPTLAWSNPVAAFPVPPAGAFLPLSGPDGTRGGYDVSPDAQQLAAVVLASALEEDEITTGRIRVVLNWFTDLENLVPSN
jgi:hypothetical protein